MKQALEPWIGREGGMSARIRDHDWSATPLGSIDQWSERFKLMVEQVLASPLVSSLACGPERILVYNDAAARLFGDRYPGALGHPLPETFSDTWPVIAPLYERVFLGESVHVSAQPLDLGGGEVFDAYLTPVRDEAGVVVVAHMIGFEISDRLRTEAALQVSEERLAHALEGGQVGAWELDLVTLVAWRSPQHDGIFGYETPLPEWTYDMFLDHVALEDRAWVDARFQDAITTNMRWSFECRIRRIDGQSRWIGAQGQIDAGAGGRSRRMKGTVRDITERKQAEIVLRASEERQAFLLRVSDALRALKDAVEIQHTATRMLGEQLRASRVFYVVVEEDGDTADILADYTDSVPSRVGRYSLSAFSLHGLGEWRAGRAASTCDVEADPRYSEAARRAYASVSTRAGFGVPLLKEGRLVAILGVNQSSPRNWSEQDLSLASEIAERTWAAVERALAEAAVRRSEERQAFLLVLSDALRPLRDAGSIRTKACRLLGEHLSASHAYYVEYQPERGCGVVADDYRRAGLPSLAGRYPFEAFRSTYERIGDGRTWVVPDVTADQELPEQERTFYATQGVLAWVNVPLAKDGVLEAALCVVQTAPRTWTELEISLVEETADRLWAAIERGRMEAELMESEERFAQFAASSSDTLWIRNATTLTMEYVSPAAQTLFGAAPAIVLGDVKRWAALIVPDDREAALRHLEQVGRGEAVVHEFRVQRPSDGSFRWIRSTDFPLHNADGGVRLIGGIAHDITGTKLAAEHTAVLLAELQHRVRNIMAMIRSITSRTGERAESVQGYADLLMGRLLALSRVQAVLTRAANISVGIRGIVQDEIRVKADHDGQYALDGPDIALSPKVAEVLTLAIHELATNALKYGALSVPTGKVSVTWSTFEERGTSWLGFDWTEEGAPVRPPLAPNALRRRGFGSELIEGRVPYELKGRGTITLEPSGAHCRLEFPLLEIASILETGAPRRAKVFGGALDMTGEPNLTGHRVMVVEDDYYIATDTARVLQSAGAAVIGPYSTEDDARAELAGQRPDAVLLDINLGQGATFKLAEYLKDNDIPFAFTTGYDHAVIPAEFDNIERLEKPFQLRHAVGAVARLTKAA